MFTEVPVEELAFGMSLFVDAGSRPMRPFERSTKAVSQDFGEGERLFLALSFGLHESIDDEKSTALLESHLSQAFFAIWNHYRNDERRASICARIVGFCQLMEKTRGGLVERWVEQGSDDVEHVVLPPAVILALASVQLSDRGTVSEGALIARILQFTRDEPEVVEQKTGESGMHWPSGTGEVARLIRGRTWSLEPLGSVNHWPSSLRTTVDLVLACAFPMIVLWGPDLLQFYNDAYRDIMGVKHPVGLGQPTRLCWHEVWAINEPIYAQVKCGETLTFENQLYPIVRYGFLEDAYFTLCYSPVRNEVAAIEGILVTVFETTARMKAGKHRQDCSDEFEEQQNSIPWSQRPAS